MLATSNALLVACIIAIQCAVASSPAFAQKTDEAAMKGRVRYDRTAAPDENQRRRRSIDAEINRLGAKVRELDIQVAGTRRANALESQNEGVARLAVAQSERREDLTAQLAAWLRTKRRFEAESQCGLTDDSRDVELYTGDAGPTREFVMTQQPATAQIQWNGNLSKLFAGAGDDPGNVQGVRWCTGTLIDANMFLTAGHCFDAVSADWTLPRRANSRLSPAELAPLMHVNFNYQVDATTKNVRSATEYPIVRLVEHRAGGLDYAIVELGRSSQGDLPAQKFRPATINAAESTLTGAKMLTIIQHPDGLPKKIAAGAAFRAAGEEISYSDVDTQGGASGAGIIDQGGRVIGVHTNGGCFETGGANSGVTLFGVSRVSNVIK